MKEKVIAIVILIIVLLFVVINTFIINRYIKEIADGISAIDTTSESAEDEAKQIHEYFKKKELFFSITVSHEDLTNIEDCFVEMIGYLSVGDADGAAVMQYRLTHSLEHLRRLSTFTIDAII